MKHLLEEYGDYIEGKMIRDILSSGKLNHLLISKALPDFDSAIDVRDFIRYLFDEGYFTRLIFTINCKDNKVREFNYKNVELTDKTFAVEIKEREIHKRYMERFLNERYTST